MLFFDENFITNFAKTHTKEARTIKEWFNRLVARIRQAMDKVKKYVTEYRAISDDVAEVERIRDLFNAALGERNANVKQNNAKETNFDKANTKYSDKRQQSSLSEFKNVLDKTDFVHLKNSISKLELQNEYKYGDVEFVRIENEANDITNERVSSKKLICLKSFDINGTIKHIECMSLEIIKMRLKLVK